MPFFLHLGAVFMMGEELSEFAADRPQLRDARYSYSWPCCQMMTDLLELMLIDELAGVVLVAHKN